MIASIFEDITTALAVLPVILLPLLLFSGLFANTNSTPVWLRWIKYLSPMYYAFVGEMEIEFSGTNRQALKVYAIDHELPPGINVVLLCTWFLGLLLMAYLVLWYKTWRRFRRNKGSIKKRRHPDSSSSARTNSGQAR